MKALIYLIGISLLLGVSAIHAQIVLSLDINDRSTSLATNDLAGFDPIVIGSVGTSGLMQTAATVRAMGPLTVTISGNGTNPGYDDRLRNVPGDSVDVSQAALYRDFIFTPSTAANAGLNVTIDGLVPNQPYKVTIWSFDSGSSGTRVSDWFANGALVRGDYTFDGRTAPLNDAQYRINFAASANGSGQIVIQGRRKPSVDANGAQTSGVFLNALQVEIGPADPPSIVLNPQPQSIFAGDNAIFTAQAGGTAPVSVQWYHDGNPVEDATNATLLIQATTAAEAGNYHLVASSPHGPDAISMDAMLTVAPVVNIRSGLLAHWPLDTFGDSTADTSGNMNDLAQASLDLSNYDFGRHDHSILFSGTEDFLSRTNDFATLPAYQYPAYTVALWVRGNGVGQNDRRVWAESSSTNNTPIVDIGTVPGGTNGTVDIFIRNTVGGGGINHRQTTLIAFDGNWHHIAWVDNNTYGRVYVDGVPDATAFNYLRGTLVADATCLGGVARTNSAINLFTGNIDDVHVWRRSLSGEEVRTVMDRVRILGIDPGGADTVISCVTATPGGAHVVQEKTNIEDAWSDKLGVMFAATGPNTFTATFPAAGGGQKFYRVIAP